MKTHPEPDEVAIVVRGIESAAWNLSQVKTWADEHIGAATDLPPGWLLHCTMCTNVLDARNELLEGAAGSPLLLDDELALALLAERLAASAITPREAAQTAYRVVVERSMSGELTNCVYYLDDGFDLADASIAGTVEEMEEETVDFFGKTVQETPSAERLRAFLEGRGRSLRSREAAEQGDAPGEVGAGNENRGPHR